jgi:PKD repeat protein
MYRTIIILFLAFVGIQLQAQYSITKQAYVLDSLNNPVANYQVVVNENFYLNSSDTLQTDANGLFVFTKQNLPHPHMLFEFVVSNPCFGFSTQQVSDTIQLNDFILCGYFASTCNAQFLVSVDSINPLSYKFIDQSGITFPVRTWLINGVPANYTSNYSIQHMFNDQLWVDFPDSTVHDVCLVVHDTLSNCIDTTCITINALNPCHSSFTYTVDTINPLQINFTNTSQGNFTSVFWDFSDGNYSAQNDPSHVYSNSGSYSPRLVVNGSGCSDTSYAQVLATLPCQASFNYSVDTINPLKVHFTNTSQGYQGYRYWRFGDGTISTHYSPVHEYNLIGNYTVSLVVGNQFCADSTQVAILLTNPNPCQASFTYTHDTANQNVVLFQNTSVGNYSNAVWDLDDGNTVLSSSGLIWNYSAPGVYDVMLKLTGPLCNDSAINSVTILPLTNCKANISFTTDSVNPLLHYFMANHNLSQTINSYKWVINNQVVSNSFFVNYALIPNAVNSICLYTADTIGQCSDSTCIEIDLTETGNVYGFAYAGTNKLDVGKVSLYAFDNNVNTLALYDTISIDSLTAGFYYFDSIPVGNYKILVEIDASSVYFSSFYSGWSSSSPLWQFADTVSILPNLITNAQVYLPSQQVQLPVGSGVISGSLTDFQGSKGVYEGVAVYLMTLDSFIIDRSYTDEWGHYSFKDLPYGNYLLLVDYAGLLCEPWYVTLSPAQNEYLNINWLVDGNNIVTNLRLAKPEELVIQIFPVPTGGQLNIHFNEQLLGSVDVKVFALTGQLLIQKDNHIVHDLITLNSESLPKGSYLLSIQLSDGNVVKKLFTKL